MPNLKFINNRSRANDILEIIYTNVHGSVTQIGYKDEKYFLTFINDYSKKLLYACYVLHETKKWNFWSFWFIKYINKFNAKSNMEKELKKYVVTIRKYINKDFYNFAKREGIYLKPGSSYTLWI